MILLIFLFKDNIYLTIFIFIKSFNFILGRTGRAGNTGVSFTFISPDEAHLAEDILRILEISNQEIPDELRSLVKNYKERLENGQVDKFRISGYIGRGNK